MPTHRSRKDVKGWQVRPYGTIGISSIFPVIVAVMLHNQQVPPGIFTYHHGLVRSSFLPTISTPQPGGRRKASPLGSRPCPLHPFAARSEPRGFPKQPSVRCKAKGQNPELWPAGPALLLALWRPAGP